MILSNEFDENDMSQQKDKFLQSQCQNLSYHIYLLPLVKD